MAVRMTKSGGIYIELRGDVAQFDADLKAALSLAKAAGKDISDALYGSISAKKAASTASGLTQYLDTASRSAKAMQADLSGLSGKFEAMGRSINLSGQGLRDFVAMQQRAFKNQSGTAYMNSLQGIRRLTGDSTAQMNSLAKSIGGVGNEFDKAGKDAGGMSSGLSAVRAQIASLVVAYAGLSGLKDIANTSINYDSLTRSFQAITGSAAGAQAQMAELRSEADRLGLDFFALSDSYKGFLAAGKSANMPVSQLKEIFTAVTEASAVMGLSSDRTKLALYALEQMISKGAVSMEELRRQLGDQLPGAFQIAAKSMGMTTAAFGKLVSTGQLSSAEFLPKFAAGIKEAFGPGLAAVLDAPRANLSRLINELNLAKVTIGEGGFLSGISDAAKELSDSLKTDDMQNALRNLGNTLGGLTGGMGKAAALAVEYHQTLLMVAASYAAVTAAGKIQASWEAGSLASIRAKVAAQIEGLTAARAVAKADLDAALALQAQAKAAVSAAFARQALNANQLEAMTLARATAAAEGQLATADALVTASKTALAGATSKANIAMGGFRGVASGLLGLVGGPWGAAFLAAGAGITYLATRQSEGEKVAAKYADAIQATKAGAESAAAYLDTLAASVANMTKAQLDAEIKTAKASVYELQKELGSTLTWGSFSLFGGPDVREIGDRFRALSADLAQGKVSVKNFRDELYKAYNSDIISEETLKKAEEFTTQVEMLNDRLQILQTTTVSSGMGAWAEEARKAAEGASGLAATLKKIGNSGNVTDISGAYNALDKLTKSTIDGKQAAIENARAQVQQSLAIMQSAIASAQASAALNDLKAKQAMVSGAAVENVQSFLDTANEQHKIAAQLQKDLSVYQAAVPKIDYSKIGGTISRSSGKSEAEKAADALKKQQDALLAVYKLTDPVKAHIQDVQNAFTEFQKNLKTSGLSKEEQERLLPLGKAAIEAQMQEFTRAEKALQSFEEKYQQAFSGRNLTASITTEMDKFRMAAAEAFGEGRLKAEEYASVLQRIAELQQRELTDASTKFQDGAARAMRDYAEEAGNAAKNAEMLFSNAFSGMEDALTSFVTTGKLNFTDFANSVITDLARIAIRQSITAPLAAGLQGLVSGLFSSSLPAGMTPGNFGTGAFAFHSGGIVGSGGTTRPFIPAVFANAKRLHAGGIIGPSEVPAILQTGERVLNRAETRDYNRGRNIIVQPQVRVHVQNNSSARVETRQSADANGNLNIDFLINEVDSRMAKRDAQGKSSFGNGLNRTRGLSRAGQLYRN